MPRQRMELVRMEPAATPSTVDVAAIPREVTPEDARLFFSIIDTSLTPVQRERVCLPPRAYPRQEEVLAVHWHPEFIPYDCIEQRLARLYPNAAESLIIPTQHNEILTWGDYAGVEVDCYSRGFNRKVQLLLHFRRENIGERAHTLEAMLRHTFKYRGSQLFELLDALILDGKRDLRHKAAAESNADATLVDYCGVMALKLKTLIEASWNELPLDMIKNKLIRNFLDAHRAIHGDRFIARCQIYVKQVKMLVKESFSLQYFYRASEVIEEARGLGGCVVIPHPEQFWPILLANYDVDGIEVWNPQSYEYTDFLINVVHRQNRSRLGDDRRLLVFMGDDCHMSEKVKDPATQEPDKAAREVGLQPPWDDMAIRKSLIISGMDRHTVIQEYKARLGLPSGNGSAA